jgi:hypothetical protein
VDGDDMRSWRYGRVPSDIELVRLEWGRSEGINECACLADYSCSSNSIEDTLASFREHYKQVPASAKDINLFWWRQGKSASEKIIKRFRNIQKVFFAYLATYTNNTVLRDQNVN